MATKIQLRRDTAAAWAAANPILSQGEAGYDITNKLLKVGDGVTAWNALQGISGEGGSGTQGIQGVQGIQGIQGSQGQFGIQGLQGIQGVLGETGAQGLQGFAGQTGSQGTQGLQGPAGFDGNQGIQGSNGLQGAQGLQGPAGGTGITMGRTYFVTKNGNDTNTGLGVDQAFATIKKALSVVSTGETILIASGTYTEVYPLDVPASVSVIGAGRHATVIKPTVETDNNDGFRFLGGGTMSDFTMVDHYWKQSTGSGYAFRIAPGATITNALPYVERVSVLYKGRITSLNDPLGFNSSADGAVAGRGVYINGADVTGQSIEAAIIMNEVTFETPASVGIHMINGSRLDMSSCQTYFADTSVLLLQNGAGFANNGKTKLRVTGLSGGYDIIPGHTITVVGGSNPSGLIESFNAVTGIIVIDGYSAGFVEGVQDVRFFSGATQVGTATEITFVDYKDFGAEVRATGCSSLYGNSGIYAEGVGVQANFFSHTFAYIGAGPDITNDVDLVNTDGEVYAGLGARVVVNSVDQSGNIRVGVSDQDFLFRPNGTLVFPDGKSQSGAAIPLSDLKTLVAASTDFNDFKSRIAAL